MACLFQRVWCWSDVTCVFFKDNNLCHLACLFQNVLLARCEGFCGKSRTNPRVSFSPVLFRPFKYYCTCCRDALSIMKAVALRCQGGEVVFATYRYIVRCSCEYCVGGAFR